MDEILLIMITYLCTVTSVVIVIPRNDVQGIRIYSLLGTLFFLFLCILLYSEFNHLATGFQFECSVPVIPEYNLNFTVGVDGLSLTLVMLTAFITPICVFAAKSTTVNYKQFIVYILLIEVFLTISFLTTNLFFFYVFFEAILIPMFLIIGVWGARERKIKAGYYFFLYTLIGSFFLLMGLLYIYQIAGTFDYTELMDTTFTKDEQKYLFWFFFIPFAVKIPMFPFHLWLPEAHVEAPTIGSVILASLLLKLGGYGFLRFTLTLFPYGSLYYSYAVYTLALLSIVYASFSAIRQTDLKRIIAYSSIAHMNLAVLGMFSFSHQGIDGAIYLMLSHGFVSSALFFCVGVLYDRHHTRLLRYYSGLVQVMPLFCTFFFIFTCANMSFPGTANFVGEFLIFSGFFMKNDYLVLFAASSIVLSAIYSIWVYNRVAYGTFKVDKENISNYTDLNREEFYILIFLAIPTLIFGINSELITSLTNVPVNSILLAADFKG